MQADSDEDDYCHFGTRIADEIESRAGAFRKPVQDQASTRALPLHKQEATDEQGRKRFHGAFTGGFSAGYFNTVGSVVRASDQMRRARFAWPACHVGHAATWHAPRSPSMRITYCQCAAGGL